MVSFRIGHGFDIHAFEEGRELILGGVPVPFDRRLKGHSDADAVLHSIADALLGAAGLGDIGGLFPDTDPSYENASSISLLSQVKDLVQKENFRVVNVDVTVIAEEPKIRPYAQAMKMKIAEVLGIEVRQVSVKGTTMERLGPIGEGRALAAEAVVLLEVLESG